MYIAIELPPYRHLVVKATGDSLKLIELLQRGLCDSTYDYEKGRVFYPAANKIEAVFIEDERLLAAKPEPKPVETETEEVV